VESNNSPVPLFNPIFTVEKGGRPERFSPLKTIVLPTASYLAAQESKKSKKIMHRSSFPQFSKKKKFINPLTFQILSFNMFFYEKMILQQGGNA
jgi:hypothetical protein